MRIYIFFISFVFLTSGCATVSSVQRNMEKVNYENGISKREAITIARTWLIHSTGYGYYKPWLAYTSKHGKYYEVLFPAFALSGQTCSVNVDSQTGRILTVVERPSNSSLNFNSGSTMRTPGSSSFVNQSEWEKEKKAASSL